MPDWVLFLLMLQAFVDDECVAKGGEVLRPRCDHTSSFPKTGRFHSVVYRLLCLSEPQDCGLASSASDTIGVATVEIAPRFFLRHVLPF